MYSELFIVDNKGQLRTWNIEAGSDGFIIRHGVYDGSMQEKYEHVPCGKVNRTQEEQIELQMLSRINKQIDKGYVYSIEEALAKRATNALGLKKPMLAQTLDKTEIDYSSAFVQRKYDGNRCIITNVDGTIQAYSRNGKPVDSIDHILDIIRLAPGESIDGELYCHGESLQTIVSWIKRKQADTRKLKFHAYDYINHEPFEERFERLKTIANKHVEIVPTYPVSTYEQMMEYFMQFRHEGYEGAIIRHTLAGYEDGKRSKSLVKVKAWQDDEFLVSDIIPSKDGWARLVCIDAYGRHFTVTCHGDLGYKQHVLLNKDEFIGEMVTVEYAYLTKDGIPFHPVAKGWRFMK
jgi:DNA ligase-1